MYTPIQVVWLRFLLSPTVFSEEGLYPPLLLILFPGDPIVLSCPVPGLSGACRPLIE